MKLSIVTTLYYSQPCINEFYQRATNAAQALTSDYELIFVNDGSPDDSLNMAVRLCELDSRVKLVDLSRNFGHHKALMTGLGYADGDLVFLLDCDLEEPPELLSKYYSKMKEADCDVVVGIQEKRKGDRFEKLSGALFYKVFNLFSTHPIPENVLISRLMTREYVQSLVSHRERELFFAGLCALTGYAQKTVTVTKGHKGKTSYSFGKKLAQTVNAIVSFSNRPLYFIFILGSAVFFLSGVYISYLMVMKFFFAMQVGFASIVASIWGIGGVMLMCTGIIGIYTGKIFSEVKQRPVIVKKLYNIPRDDNS